MKKDKRYNNQIDNYTDSYANTFKLGLVMVVIGSICYGVYRLYNYLF